MDDEKAWWDADAVRLNNLCKMLTAEGHGIQVTSDHDESDPHRNDGVANKERCPECGSRDVEEDGDECVCEDCGHRWE